MVVALIQTEETLDRLLQAGDPVVVVFSAKWCKPCKIMAPIVDEFAKDFENYFDVVKVDIDRHDALAQQFEIKSVPTTLLFLNGNEHKRMVGSVDKQALATFVLDEIY